MEKAALEVAKLKPAFMSVTSRGRGRTSRYTVGIASDIQRETGVNTLAHLTCVSSTRSEVKSVLKQLREKQLKMCWRFAGTSRQDGPIATDYRYASGAYLDIKQFDENLCIGAACYPEGHVESVNKTADIEHLRDKVEAGCDFVTTQMFFDNNILYNYLYRIRERGITVPVVAGIMPVTNVKQIKRIRPDVGYLPSGQV